MKKHLILTGLAALFALSAAAQTGAPYIHDPSTIQFCDGKYYTFGTGGGGLISVDGWVWEGGAVRPGGGAAPDAIRIGDRYLVGYSATGGGLGGGHAGRVLTMWNRTLDPSSPDFAFTEPVEVAHSEVDEDCDAIYSDIHGVEEDGPLTGLEVYPNPTDGVLFVETHGRASLSNQTYRITNLMGQTLLTDQITAETQQIDVTGLAEGMYFITSAGETRKFVVR